MLDMRVYKQTSVLARMFGKTDINPTTARQVVGGKSRLGACLVVGQFAWLRCRSALGHNGCVEGAMKGKRTGTLRSKALLCHLPKRSFNSSCPRLTEWIVAPVSLLGITLFSYAASTIVTCGGRSCSVSKRDCVERRGLSLVQVVFKSGVGRDYRIFRLMAMVAEVQKGDLVQVKVNCYERDWA